ncbi:bifunctional oligoribonuclease/PAP phosphatase NrnA [soil metagenome]
MAIVASIKYPMVATELTPKQQFAELVRNAQSILLVTHHNPDGDAAGSILAMKLGLEKLGKEISVVAGGEAQEPLAFLPSFQTLKEEVSLQKELLIVLDESQAKIGNISLKRIAENKLVVVVTPKGGTMTPANVRVEEGSFKVDLIIALDCANLERIGSLYEENTELFYEVPVVNIDHHASNNNFGKVNLVDLTASSTAEILVSLLETIGKEVPGMIDAEIATCLLTGITTDTGSFQNANTTPKSLTVAAQLVAAGGRQQEIIKHIFRTRSLSTLRLWGRALSYIKEDQDLAFAWSTLSKADFVAAQAETEQSSGVIDELLKTAMGMNFVLLISEREGNLHGSFRSVNQSTDVSALAALFGGGGHPQAAAFSMNSATLKDQEQEIIKRLRDHLNGKSDKPAQPSAPTKPETKPAKQPEQVLSEGQETEVSLPEPSA